MALKLYNLKEINWVEMEGNWYVSNHKQITSHGTMYTDRRKRVK